MTPVLRLAVFAACACSGAVLAAGKPGSPSYAYDAASVVLPDQYPARSYTARELTGRFAELANGPEVSREDLEREFGVRYVPYGSEYVARGRRPLGNFVSYFSGDRAKKDSLRGFSFSMLDEDAKGNPDWGHAVTCVSAAIFQRELGEGWVRQEMQHPYRVLYHRDFGDHRRTAELSTGDCPSHFSLWYRPPLPPANR